MSEVGMKSAKAVIYLSACALHGAAPERERLEQIDDWNALYRLAKRHSMTAIVCMALEAGGAFSETGRMERMEPDLVKQWKDDKNKSIRKTMLMDEEYWKIVKFMESNGIWYMPLKGLVIKDLYPKCGMRQMADYDILFDPDGQKKLQAYMTGRGYQKKGSEASVHDAYYKAPVYNFELHRALFGKSHRAVWSDYYRNVKERLVPDEGFRYRFRDEDFYVYMVTHACKHHSGGGTGLRSLMDCYVYCEKKGDALDWHAIETELGVLGLVEFEHMFRELAFCLFSEPDADAIDALTEKQREDLGYLIGSGTYGTTGHRVENQLHALQRNEDAVRGKTRLHYLWRRLFPDMAWFRANVPFCYRHKWSVPFYVVYRMLRGLICARTRIWGEIRAVRRAK